MLERTFHLSQRQTTIGREVLGGAVTFMALSYIIFVQPAIMSMAGTEDNPLDFGAVMFATCVASAFACVLMGLLANLPVALAPAMGHNVLFAFTICVPLAKGGFGLTWQQALAANFIAGALFVLMSFFGLRKAILAAMPDSLKYAIAVGIAWGFIAYALLKVVTGRGREAHGFVYLFAALFVAMYVLKWMPGTAV